MYQLGIRGIKEKKKESFQSIPVNSNCQIWFKLLGVELRRKSQHFYRRRRKNWFSLCWNDSKLKWWQTNDILRWQILWKSCQSRKIIFNLWIRLMSRVQPVNPLFQTLAKGNDVIANVISINQRFASTFSIQKLKFLRRDCMFSFIFRPATRATRKGC